MSKNREDENRLQVAIIHSLGKPMTVCNSLIIYGTYDTHLLQLRVGHPSWHSDLEHFARLQDAEALKLVHDVPGTSKRANKQPNTSSPKTMLEVCVRSKYFGKRPIKGNAPEDGHTSLRTRERVRRVCRRCFLKNSSSFQRFTAVLRPPPYDDVPFHLLSKTPHFMAAFGLIQRAKLHVVLSSVALRSCIEPRNAFATVGFTRD